MKINKNLYIILLTSLFLFSCSNAVEGFKLKKKSSAGEEFLIEKKDPLILPPEFSNLPKPNEEVDNNQKEEISLETVLKKDNKSNSEVAENESNSDSSIKKSILKKIQK